MAATTGLSLFGGVGRSRFFNQGAGPIAFVFTTQQGVALSQAAVVSNQVVINGVDAGSTISVSGDAGYGYSLNGGAYQTVDGTVNDGDTLRVRVDASANYNSGTSVTVTINDLSVTFVVVTLRNPNPDAVGRAPVTRLHARR